MLYLVIICCYFFWQLIEGQLCQFILFCFYFGVFDISMIKLNKVGIKKNPNTLNIDQ